MNINAFRNVVILGNIATLRAQINTWQIYANRTGESVVDIVLALNAQIAALMLMISV